MMKRFLILALLSTICAQYLTAQVLATISGQVLAGGSNKIVAFAAVTVLTENNNLVAGRFTSEDGRFTIECLSKGIHIVEVSGIGFSKYRKEVFVGELNRDYDLGKIRIWPSAEGPGGSPDNQLDRKTVFPSQSVAQPGGSVSDALSLIPGISFNQEGNLLLGGSDRVIVLIDGKQSNLTGKANKEYFNDISANSVRSVDVYSSPLANYDAESIAGVINITYPERYQSEFHGGVGFAYGRGVFNQAKADLPTEFGSYSPTWSYAPSLNLTWITKRLSFKLQADGLQQRSLPNNEFTTRYYDNGKAVLSQVPENRRQTRYGFNGSIAYRLDEKNAITFTSNYHRDIRIDSAQVPYIKLEDYSRYRFISWKQDEAIEYSDYALNYTHEFDKPGEEFSTTIRYSNDWTSEVYNITDSSGIRKNGRDITRYSGAYQTASLSLGYTRPWRTGRFEIGTNLRTGKSPVRYYQETGENSSLYPGLGNRTEMRESVFGAYFNWIHEKKWYDIQLGIRPEYTTVVNEIDPSNHYYPRDDEYAYFRFFPDAIARLKINSRNNFSARYHQRVDRPGRHELRMLTEADDYELVKVGNPYLRPQFTNEYELRYQSEWKSGSVGLSAYLWSIRDMYTRVYTLDETSTAHDVILKSFANIRTAVDRGLVLDFSQRFFKFWEISGKARYYQLRFSSYEGSLLFPNEHDYYVPGSVGNSWDAMLVSTFSFSDYLQFRVSGIYMSPKILPQGRELERSAVDVGLMMKIFKGKGIISIDASDLFIKNSIRQELNGPGFKVLYENYYETQILRIAFKYSF